MFRSVLNPLSLYLLVFGNVACTSPECPEIKRLSQLGAQEVLQHHYGGGINLETVIQRFAYIPTTESYAIDLRMNWTDSEGGLHWAEGTLRSGKEIPLSWTEISVSRSLQTTTF